MPVKITGSFVAGFLLTAAVSVQADSPVFGNSPGNGTAFSLAFASGNTWGGAVLFTPSQNIELSSVTMWLSGYTAQCGVTPSVSIYDSYQFPNHVYGLASEIVSLNTPAANDGSSAAFTFTDSSGTTLDAGQDYWLFAYGSWNGNGNFGGASSYWDAGTTPIGAAVLDQSDFFNNGGLMESGLTPAFSINSDSPTVGVVPEPNTLTLLAIPALLGIGRLFYNRQKAEAKKLAPVKVRGKKRRQDREEFYL
jgi:hypothetical protein